ncbi:Hypothetical protein GLP15_2600 [Giardia lamblia P15]|uniref:Phosducin family protein n=1 Tax=Giardia intestinalis (strain P15) TaxID=658858 RepID=E1F8T1_GIAIA|nr:Hypothetical protein GLP15_2600 [Giardia lamblia P15]
MQWKGRADAPNTTQWQDIFDKKAYGKTALEVYEEANTLQLQAEEYARHQAIRKQAVKRFVTDASSSDSLDLSEEDRAFMEDYKAKLVSKLTAAQNECLEQFTEFREITAEEYTSWIADGASIVLLHDDSVRTSVRTLEMLRRLSERYIRLRTAWIKATDACKGYPKELCPTLVVYLDGKPVHNFVGPEACGGSNTTMEYLEILIGAYLPLRSYTFRSTCDVQDEIKEVMATKLRMGK